MSIFDLRARSYCNLGELINWSISDDYAQGNGVIKYRGQLEIKGLVRPAIGDPVLIGYEQPGVLALIPRKLRVLSVFCNPAEYITKLDVGCKLTYLEDLKGLDDGMIEEPLDGNSEYDTSDEEQITIPVAASYAMSVLLNVLGITAASNPLTSRFSMGRYVFKEGYVKKLDDLLKSECYRGFLDENEVLQIRSGRNPLTRGPVITPEQIIALGPINAGRLPGDAVSVSYSTIKIEADSKEKDNTDLGVLKRRWEYDESIGEIAKSIVQWNDGNDENYPSGKTYIRTWQPITKTRTTYRIKQKVLAELGTGIFTGNTLVDSKKVDSYWVKDKTVETRNGVLSAGAGNLCSSYLSNGVSFYDREYESTVTTTYEHDDDGNEIKNTKITEEPQAVVFGRLGLNYYYDEGGAVSLNYQPVVTDKVITETTTANGNPKTYTTRWLFYPLTQEGQQSVAETRDLFQSAGAVSSYLNELLDVGLVCVGTSSQSQTKSWDADPKKDENPDPVAEGRSSLADLDNANGRKDSSESQIAWAIGNYSNPRRIQFTLPDAPDDYWAKSGDSYYPVRGNAYVKAVNFGITENRMLLGHRNGMNVQLPISLVPPYPLDVIYVNANGYVAQYRMNGTHYVGSKDGIVVTTDLMYWAGAKSVDTPAEAWIPTAPGTTGANLPKVIPATNANPSPANAVAIPTDFDRTDLEALFGEAAGGTGSGVLVGGIAPVYETELVDPLVVPPFTLSIDVVGGIGIGASMGQYGYALSVSLDVAPSVIGIGARFLSIYSMPASGRSVALGLLGARLIYSRRALELPVAFSITANAAGFRRIYRLSGQSRALAASFNSANLAKGIVPTYKLAAAAGSYAIAGGTVSMAKGTATDPYFANVSLLLNGDSFTDLSSNALTVTPQGNAAIVSGQGPFGGPAMAFDGDGDYLSTGASAGFAFGTGDFTIEGWVYIAASTLSYPTLFVATYGGGTKHITVRYGDSGFGYRLQVAVDDSALENVYSANIPQSLYLDQWVHVAFTRASSVCKLFVNSSQQNLASGISSSYDISSFTSGDDISSVTSSSIGENFNGLIGPLRITKGIARAITVPTAPFPTTQATDVVTSGLTLYLDAGNTASYPGTGTTWTDLSGNGNNGTLVNGVGYSSANGGALVFDGTNDYATLPTDLITHLGGEPFTICVWFKKSGSGIILGQQKDLYIGSTTFYVPAISITTDGKLATSCFLGTVVEQSFSSTLSDNTWYFACVTYSSGYQYSYLNGSLYATLAKGVNPTFTGPFLYSLGGGTADSENWFVPNPFLNGSIGAFATYARALTATEITQNFNALRGRFGL